MKNPLAVCGIVGILAGYLVSYLTTGDIGTYTTYGLIGGLIVGYLLDSKNRQSASTKTPTRPSSQRDVIDVIEKPASNAVDQAVDTVENTVDTAVESGRSRVSRVDEAADDVIARAREEIAKNTGDRQS